MMKKVAIPFMLIFSFLILQREAYAATINEADSELCDTLKYALINSLRKPIDEAIQKIYEHDELAPEGLTWASYETDILKIQQANGIGGAYTITLLVKPYYRAHLTYGEDLVVIREDGKLISYKHLKTYPNIDF
ncbi:DUF3888 domain-containing protein [Rossellomorea aquimaris]|uniref:DUF3888 domain-containing protein n=1 Tax=Rossellomorea aquimaris TaxID=189382 RepID=UPI001CD625E0|nr:DUF3888 domain-containing protein [Rossellomorea aquimaris]MCA1055873.1 DUF3888 domain-containing protein [Rossellomorea aquimaris]